MLGVGGYSTDISVTGNTFLYTQKCTPKSLSVTCDMLVVLPGSSGFLHQ